MATPTPGRNDFSLAARTFDEVVSRYLDELIAEAAPHIERDTPEFFGALRTATSGGKRLRAIAGAVGALAAGRHSAKTMGEVLDRRILALGAALEFYQAAALVNDDVIDRSPERRGLPAIHTALAAAHGENHWHGSAGHFGIAGSILAANFLLAAADRALETAATKSTFRALTGRFTLMTSEVAYGQYLDLRTAQMNLNGQSAITDALQVVRLKSARYSVAHPVVLGAIASGGDAMLARTLEEIFEPAGIAFQLRDDALGVFGDHTVIGKSTSSDIQEKKRTALIALTYSHADTASRSRLQAFYTADHELGNSEIAEVRDLVSQYGHDPHEDMIAHYHNQATVRLEGAPLSSQAKSACQALIDRLILRES